MKDGQTGDQMYHGTGTLLTMDLTGTLWVCVAYECIVPENIPTPTKVPCLWKLSFLRSPLPLIFCIDLPL